ncbi:EndoU domain-containing protein [uncultured Gilliamella sp.]|uniref:EndoU domain-containing protein n=1 Tax=Gilliamella sp. W8145 TaxID=2750990 RepID=UPI0018DE2A75|nr:EndoU domain-containing protein [uncultured Gilliamella sp.]
MVAELQGNSGLAGGAGAVVGEIAADIIRKQLYGKDVKELTEEEKETISALSQLTSGLAVAAGGGNIGDASAAISSSKNAVENNYVNVGLAMVKAAEAVCNGDKACEQQVIKEGIDSYNEMIIEGGTLQVIVLGTLIVAPAAIAAAEAGMAACSVNPVLCANQVAIWVMETIGAEAMPAAGLGMSAAELAKSLSKAQLKELSALMAMEKSGELTPGLAKKLKEFLNKTPETNIVTKGSSATNKVVVNEKGLENAGKGTTSTESKVGEYLEDFKPSPTPTELVQQQAGKGTQVTINTDHILNGEIKTYKNGKKVGTGGHYLKDPNIKVDKWTGEADANGVTKGYISVRDPATGKWYEKQGETTFFPKHWSKRQTEMEIKSAFENSKPDPNNKDRWIGISSSGIKMQGFYKKPGGTGATAWPIYNKGK